MRRAAAALVVVLLAACAGEDNDDGERCAGCPPGQLVWSEIVGLPTITIDALAPMPHEPPWFAGTFQDVVGVEGFSRGSDGDDLGDLFIARAGRQVFDRPYLGVAAARHPVRTVGVAPDGEEGAIGVFYMTDPNSGVRAVEASWLGRDEIEIRRATLATVAAAQSRAVVASMATDPHGWPIVAVAGVNIDAGEDPEVTGSRSLVMRLGQGLRRELLISLPGIEVLAIASASADTAVIGGRYSDAPEGWPACPEAYCGFVATIDAGTADGEPIRWTRVLRSAGGAEVRAVAATPTGTVYALVEAAGPPIDPLVGGGGDVTMYLAHLRSDGTDVTQIPLATAPNVVSGRALAITDDGHPLVALSLEGAIAAGSFEFASDTVGAHDAVVFEIHPLSSGAVWMVPIRSNSDVTVGPLAAEGNLVAIGGAFDRTLYLPSGAVHERQDLDVARLGFVMELAR